MTIELKPEDEHLIQRRLQSGGFATVQEVIHHALQVQDAEEAWMELHKREVREKIDRAIAEFDQGGGIPASSVRRSLQEMKSDRLAENK
jgi:Arc/MetJ-type ribon-helix-helix transcriptional regulator